MKIVNGSFCNSLFEYVLITFQSKNKEFVPKGENMVYTVKKEVIYVTVQQKAELLRIY